jgi:hypothetical protein
MQNLDLNRGMVKNNGTLLLVQDDAYLPHLILDKKRQNLLDLFWVGFLAYTFGYAISQTTYANWIICQFFQSVGIVLLLIGTLQLIQVKFDNLYIRFLYSIYCLWLIITIMRGATTDYQAIKLLLFDAWFGVLLYFVPILLLFPRNLFFYKRLFDVILVLGISFVVLSTFYAREIIFADKEDLISRGIVEVFARTLGMPVTFLVLIFSYQSRPKRIIAIVITLLIIFLGIFKARRGLILLAFLPLLVAYIFYVYQSKSKILVFIYTLSLASIVLIYGISIYQKSSLFTYLKDRGLEDTRTNVELCYYNDMTTKDWLIGKGLFGEYFCPGIDEGNKTGYRPVIETDYLQTILKGGIISFGLLLLIIFPAAILGIFKSKNMLSKAAGIWILLAILNMYPSNVNTFTLNYCMVWIAVGLCYSPVIRSLPEDVLKLYFNPG